MFQLKKQKNLSDEGPCSIQRNRQSRNLRWFPYIKQILIRSKRCSLTSLQRTKKLVISRKSLSPYAVSSCWVLFFKPTLPFLIFWNKLQRRIQVDFLQISMNKNIIHIQLIKAKSNCLQQWYHSWLWFVGGFWSLGGSSSVSGVLAYGGFYCLFSPLGPSCFSLSVYVSCTTGFLI